MILNIFCSIASLGCLLGTVRREFVPFYEDFIPIAVTKGFLQFLAAFQVISCFGVLFTDGALLDLICVFSFLINFITRLVFLVTRKQQFYVFLTTMGEWGFFVALLYDSKTLSFQVFVKLAVAITMVVGMLLFSTYSIKQVKL